MNSIARDGFLGRIFDAILEAGHRVVDALSDSSPEEQQAFTSEYDKAFSQADDVSSFDWTRVSPEESGIPPAEGESEARSDVQAWNDMGYDLGITDENFAMQALWTGWYDLDASSDDRLDARQMFFDYLGWDEYEFDWDDWRDWYASTSG